MAKLTLIKNAIPGTAIVVRSGTKLVPVQKTTARVLPDTAMPTGKVQKPKVRANKDVLSRAAFARMVDDRATELFEIVAGHLHVTELPEGIFEDFKVEVASAYCADKGVDAP